MKRKMWSSRQWTNSAVFMCVSAYTVGVIALLSGQNLCPVHHLCLSPSVLPFTPPSALADRKDSAASALLESAADGLAEDLEEQAEKQRLQSSSSFAKDEADDSNDGDEEEEESMMSRDSSSKISSLTTMPKKFPVLHIMSTRVAVRMGCCSPYFWLVLFCYTAGLTPGIYTLTSAKQIFDDFIGFDGKHDVTGDEKFYTVIYTLVSIFTACE